MAIKPVTNKNATYESTVNRETQTSIRSEKGNAKVVIKKPGGQNAGKGFAIGAAALAALAIIAAFVETVAHNRGSFELLLSDPRVLVGMFIGISIPFLISSITMTAVGDAAFDMINEIRRQFREIPGHLIMMYKENLYR